MFIPQLEKPVRYTNYIQPLCLPPPNQTFKAGTAALISGWGMDKGMF